MLLHSIFYTTKVAHCFHIK